MRYGIYRNNEGYFDPTAGQAMANVMWEQKKQLAVKRKTLHKNGHLHPNCCPKKQEAGEWTCSAKETPPKARQGQEV